MENFKVPYGFDFSGNLISASNAERGKAYTCPCCNSQLVHRSGEVRVKHFAHPASSNCSLESILHITAKRLVEAVMLSNSSSQKEINFRNHCHQCGIEFNTVLPYKTFTSAKLEVAVSEYVCDVVGYRNNEIALGVEILNTHEVDSRKATNLPIYWLELKAEDVIAMPNQWNPTQSKLKSSFCKSCKSHLKHVQSIADRWNIERNLYSPIKEPASSVYIADTEKCFKCQEEIPVFWWRGVPFCEQAPPEPKPKTIKHRSSKQYGGKYWANTCANCNMIQGDNYLYIFEGAPFKNMPLAGEEVKRQSGIARVVSGKSAVPEFMKVINRNF